VIGPPHGGVKEQSPGIYANELAKRGFVVLAHDPSFYGESGGENHFATSPELLTEDFSAGVDFLGTLDQVDRERIGVIGICASGGFALNAAAIDTRIKGVAAMTMYDIPGLARDGWLFEGDADARKSQLDELAAQRWADVDSGERAMSPVFPLDEYDASELDPITAEFFEYYAKVNDRGWHPRSVGGHRITSSLPHIAYGQLRNLDDIAPRQVLIAVGDQAHSRWFSEKTYDKIAGTNKALVIVPEARHIDLYDYVEKIPFDKLEEFFTDHLRVADALGAISAD
jgi:fermentation-respiration switch protein FrsA (DUF1100 family)